MKNLKYIIILAFLIVYSKSFGQFPLKFGDGVITHSPTTFTLLGPSTTPAVVRVIHTSDTSTATLGTNWNTSSMLPSGSKPDNDFYPNWNVNTLGYVFGITIDENINPNAYVSSTQIYGSSTMNDRKIWRLQGNTGANTLVFDFNNISGTGTNTSLKSLGNLKYYKFGTTENIYVSDWETGEIHRLTGNSTASLLWSNQQAFNPKFGKNNDDKREMPYGLAIRRISSSSSKLYYSKISTDNNANLIGGYGNNEIYSVDLDAFGNFITGTETIVNIPNINLNPGSWGGYSGYPPSYGCQILPVISDIAFTSDGKKMLVGQQPWGNFGVLAPHNAQVKEFENIPLLSTNWINTANLFPAGIFVSQSCSSTSAQNNSVGGVSYSDNKLRTNMNFACDDAVYFTADYINTGGIYVYGVEGMNANGGSSNSLATSLWIDADDNLTYYDKSFLGDVEIYRNPENCAPCDCGNWASISLGDNASWWTNSSQPGVPPPPFPPLSFNQGSTSGILFPHYNCTGNCDSSFTYNLISASGTLTALSGGSSIDLGQTAIKNLPCGSYFITITPTCGQTKCPPTRIPLVIVCPPPCSDCGGNASVTSNGTPTISNGTISGNFTINNSKPVSEVRVLVEEFKVTSNNENCLICKNPPKTWGSIQTATLGALSPSFSNAVTVDNREVVFNNNAVLPMPSNMAITLALPQSVYLSCCEVQVQVCLKFIIRDVNCCEKEVLKCFTFTLPQSK